MGNFMKTGGLVILGLVALLAYSALFIVDEREKALVIRFGEIQRTVSEPGLYMKIPFFEELQRIEDRILFMETNDKSVQVVDGRRYLVDSITMLRIVDAKTFRETAGGNLNVVGDRISTRIESALRQTYGRRTFDAALSQDRSAMMREIRDQVRPEAKLLGVEIVDVRIRRTDLMPDVLNDTYERMNAERFAEAAELRAIGQAQATKIKAEADRSSVELVSKAQRESEIIRGDGDASRNKVFADAFARDPEFFAFYRSMQAYARSLSGSETTLVLNPDSEFFRYFGTQGLPKLTNEPADPPAGEGEGNAADKKAGSDATPEPDKESDAGDKPDADKAPESTNQ